MLWNFLGNISNRNQERGYQNGSELNPGERQPFANAPSPAFDAWLQVYRKRLEEVHQLTHSGRVSPTNANG